MKISPERVVMMEDHDKAYLAWKVRGVRSRVLVHVDAHIDFGWIPEADMEEIGAAEIRRGTPVLINPFIRPRARMLTIGNYICPAIREGMVKKFFWVVPDPSLRSPRGRSQILRQLKQLLRTRACAGEKLRREGEIIRCRIMGCELVVCGLESLEKIGEPALLDIDTDFMLTPRIWDDLEPARRPWIFPEELLKKLEGRLTDVDVLTIAYSVEGGFTPLRFKYLGDELRCLCLGTVPAAMAARRCALAHEVAMDMGKAVAAYQEAAEADPGDASAWYNLFLLHLDGKAGDPAKARECFAAAVARDGSYATAYNNYGILYLRTGRLKDAEREYRKFLACAGENARVLSGLGRVALARKRYGEAQDHFDRCLRMDAKSFEARAGKAVISFLGGRLEEAEKLFSALRDEDPDDAEACWWLGRIAEKKGDLPAAVRHYKETVMRGGEGPCVHLRLCRLYLARGFYLRACEELARLFSTKVFP